MSRGKSIVVFDHDSGEMDVIPLGPGGFVTLVQQPLKLHSRTDEADGTITLVLKLDILPPSAEGAKFLEDPAPWE